MKVTEAHVEARKNQILDAAWECFAELGYHQTTMAAIAAAAGLSTGAIYLYFESKEALMTASSERSQAMSRRIVEQARAGSDDPLVALASAGRVMLAVFQDERFAEATRVNIELWPEILRNEEMASNWRKDLVFWKETVTQLLAEAKEKGELREGVDPRNVALLVIAAFEGLRHYKLIDPEFSEEVLLQAFLPMLNEGRALSDDFTPPSEIDLPGPPSMLPRRERQSEED